MSIFKLHNTKYFLNQRAKYRDGGGRRPTMYIDELYPRTMLKHKIRPITRLQGTVGGKQMLRNYHNYSALIG